jgi:hypothetical protein
MNFENCGTSNPLLKPQSAKIDLTSPHFTSEIVIADDKPQIIAAIRERMASGRDVPGKLAK